MYIMISSFDPSNEEHVRWLKRMMWVGENMGDGRIDVLTEVNNNPMGQKLDKILDWPQIHFGLAMKYARYALKSTDAE